MRTLSGQRSKTSLANFYVWMAMACILVAFGGFAPTYWLPLATGGFMDRGPLVDLHAALFAF